MTEICERMRALGGKLNHLGLKSAPAKSTACDGLIRECDERVSLRNEYETVIEDQGIESYDSPCLSPDGEHFAFVGYESGEESQIFMYSFDSKIITRLAYENLNDYKYGLNWSPDGKWLSYHTYEGIKVRAEGSLWEADFEEVKQKLLSQD